MPEFSSSRSDAIRSGLIARAARAERASTPAPSPTASTAAAPTGERRPNRRCAVQWVTAAIALVLLGTGVAATANLVLDRNGIIAATPTPTPTPTSSASDAPTPTVPPSPEPTIPPPAQDPADPSTWVITRNGMGPLTIGMPFTAAIDAVPEAQDACGHAYFLPPDNLYFARWGANADDPLDVVSWARAEGPRTAEGIGVGSSPDDVRAAYPDVVEVQRQGLYLQSGSLFFRIETGLVDEIGVTSGDVPYEFCG